MNLSNFSHEICPLLVMQVPNEKGTMMNFVSAGIPMFAVSRNFTLTNEDFHGLRQLGTTINVSYLLKYFPEVAKYISECIHKASGQRNILHCLRSAQNFESILVGICSMHGVDRETGCDIFVGEFLQTWIKLLEDAREVNKIRAKHQAEFIDEAVTRLSSSEDRLKEQLSKVKDSQQLFRGRRSVESFCDKLDSARETIFNFSHESRLPYPISDGDRRLLESVGTILQTVSGETRHWADQKWPKDQAKDNEF